MSSTTDTPESDLDPPTTEAESSDQRENEQRTRLFWSDGHVVDETYEELEAPDFNYVEAGYLADDESDCEDDDVRRFPMKVLKRSHESSIASSLFQSDSDSFEEKAEL
ncbi:unnamed protein product [Caenorhabditis sp. 36 PRJEB53466]|nr:unnamed protein product [Caenorhabditis sp. 36 PRJEB53466]